MDASFDEIRRSIAEIAPGLHSAGTFPTKVFEAIADAAYARRNRNSAETGCGASTLLLSHLSAHHTVFAADGGSGSVTNVKRSSLLRPGVVAFVDGPTQQTLPQFTFHEKLQLVLIDGPHGYPFPDLEYYFLYPHLETGALLILDDIHIPTVHNLFRFLRQDAMFQLDKVVQSTAFFTRTNAPTFDPLGDGWQRQNYNARLLRRYTWREEIRKLLPPSVRRNLRRTSSTAVVRILAPQPGAAVTGTAWSKARRRFLPIPFSGYSYARKDFDGWWPQGAGAIPLNQGKWQVTVTYGGSQDAGQDFEIAALVVRPPTHQLWTDWVSRVKETGSYPPVSLPPASAVLGQTFLMIRKRA